MKIAYLAGFFDGEGSLILRFRKDPRYKSGFQIKPNIDITQKDPQILKQIKSQLNMGQLYLNKKENVWHYDIYKIEDILKFIEIVEADVIVKKRLTKRFKACLMLMKSKKHTSSAGFNKIKKIWTARKSEANTP